MMPFPHLVIVISLEFNVWNNLASKILELNYYFIIVRLVDVKLHFVIDYLDDFFALLLVLTRLKSIYKVR